MGIQDRDYMKRRQDDDSNRGASPDSGAEAALERFLQNNRRLFLYAGVALGVLIVIALAVAKFS